MVKGIYTSASGMITQYKKMDVISNNIANTDTVGYKKDGVITESFGEVLVTKINDPSEPMRRNIGTMSYGAKVDNIFTNFSQGSLVSTMNPLNMALDGEGFFTISVVDETGQAVEMYSRDGSFSVSNQGQLVTAEGHQVLGTEGPINIPTTGSVVIDKDGKITVDGEYINTLKLIDFEDKSTLRKIGDSLYEATDPNITKIFEGSVEQGFIEGSNVQVVKEMIEMINISRAYESSQKVLQANDDALGKAVNEVGRL